MGLLPDFDGPDLGWAKRWVQRRRSGELTGPSVFKSCVAMDLTFYRWLSWV